MGRSLIPLVHHYFETVIHFAALLLNILLFVIVSRRTTLRYADFKYVIQQACVSDIMLSIAFFLCQPVCLKVEDTFVFFSNGFFAMKSPALDFWLTHFATAGVQANIVFLPVPFVYRYFTVCRGAKANWSLLLKICIVPTFQALYGMIGIYKMLDPTPEYQRLVMEKWAGLV
ncbi:hypothetical protein AAVH_18263 [Aphelenchoides avenae]|nr:hypothetical protein AAVH_18263 [Aphelenchus avenae]